MPGKCWKITGQTLEKRWNMLENAGNMLENYWKIAGKTMDNCWKLGEKWWCLDDLGNNYLEGQMVVFGVVNFGWLSRSVYLGNSHWQKIEDLPVRKMDQLRLM